ncbi:hypothetical protein ACIQMJ_40695 [Actinosynnema sp. NPDC091369]
MSEHVWSLETFDRATGEFVGYRILEGFSDDEVLDYLELDDVGAGDVYEIPLGSMNRIASRYEIVVDHDRCEYLLARVAAPSGPNG